MTDHQNSAPDHAAPGNVAAVRAAHGLQVVADQAATQADLGSGAPVFTTGRIRTAADQGADVYRKGRYRDARHYLAAMTDAMDQVGVPADTAHRRTLAAFRTTLTDHLSPDTKTTP